MEDMVAPLLAPVPIIQIQALVVQLRFPEEWWMHLLMTKTTLSL